MKKNPRLSGKEKAQYIGILVLYPFLLLFGWMGKTMKLFGTKRRQIIASVLSFAMILTILPAVSLTAFAAATPDTSVGLDFASCYTDWKGTGAYEGVEWEYASKTLTLTNATIHGADSSTASEIYGLKLPDGTTIVLNGANTVKSGIASADNASNLGIYSTASLTISGTGSLVAIGGPSTGSGTTHSGGLVAATGGLTINSGTVTAIGGSAVNSAGVIGNMTVNDGIVNVIGGYATAISYGSTGAVNINGGLLTAKSGVAPTTKAFASEILSGTSGYILTGETASNFCVVGSSSVYKVLNAALDFSAVPADTGTLAANGYNWTQSTKTLTIKNLVLNAPALNAISLPDGAILDVQGINVVRGKEASSTYDVLSAVYSAGTLTIQNSGVLNAFAGGGTISFIRSYGIYAGGNISISNTSINAFGGTSTWNSHGIYQQGSSNLVISSGNILGVGGTQIGSNSLFSAGLCASDSSVTVSDGDVTAIGGEIDLTSGTNTVSTGFFGFYAPTISGGNVVAIGSAAISGVAQGKSNAFFVNAAGNPAISGGKVTAIGYTWVVKNRYTLSNFETVTLASANIDGSNPVPYNSADIQTYKYTKLAITKSNLTAANFNAVAATVTYNGSPKSVTPAYIGGITAAQAGAITTCYAVAGGTDYSYSAPINAGIYDVFVTTAGGPGYNALNTPTKVGTITINKANTAISVTANPTAGQTRPNSITLSATGLPEGATGTLTFKASGNVIGTPVSVGQSVSFAASGSANSYLFTVVYSGDSNYASATSGNLIYGFTKGEQSALSFAAGTPTAKTYGDNAFTVNATGGSGTGAVSYSVVSGPATVSGNTVTLTGAGSVVLRTTKAADNDYNEKSVETTITVSKKPVTITGVTAQNKTYDGNKTATISGTAVIDGKMGGDIVSVSGGSATFADKIVDNGKPVTFTGFSLSGTDADKYILTDQPADVTANITAKPITINVNILDKAYDGTNTAAIASASLNDVVPTDAVSLVTPYPTVIFTSVSAANNIPVSFGGNFTLTGVDAGNYILTQPTNVTANINAGFTAVKDVHYSATPLNAGWTKSGFEIAAEDGYQVSRTNTAGGNWFSALIDLDETNSGSMTFYIKNMDTGEISAAKTESYKIDKTAPTGDIKHGVSSIKKALNTITFGFFFKSTQTISITSSDTGSGVASVSYKLSSVILDETAVKEISDWTAYTGAFTIQPNSKTVVYVKITDTVGNVTYLGAEGVVLFTDSTAKSASVSFAKTSTADAIVSVNLNGNTIKEVRIGGNVLTKNTDYTADGGIITLKAAYLDTLAAGNHTILIDFYPMGENADYGLGSGAAKISIPLTVSKTVPALSITVNPTGSQTRPGSVTLSASLPAGAAGMLQFTANGINIGTPVAVSQTVTFTASGSVNEYEFMVSYSGDDNYAAATSNEICYSFIKGEQSSLSFATGTPTAKIYGDNPFSVTATGGSSTGAITYSVVSGPATVSGNTVTLTGAGSVILRATKAADNDYNAKSVETTISVSKKLVTITGVTAQNKTYDGNKTAAISGTALIDGKMGGDIVSISGGSATFADKIVGNGKPVTFTGFTLSGTDADKYTLSAQPANVTANITAKPITVAVTVKSKYYDGLNAAEISSAALNDVVSTDAVSLVTPYPTATFTSVSAANNIPVSFGGNFTLTGADAGNYNLTQPSGITSNITNNYSAVKGTDYTASTTQWSKTDFVVTAKTGFELSLTDTAGGAWSETLTKSDETASGSLTFYVRNKTTGAISLAAAESYKIDKTAPTGDIKIGASSIKKALNAITFGRFFKDTQSIEITSADTGSGVASVSYKLSPAVLDETAVRDISDWTSYTGALTVEPDSKTIVYVKITDTAGNVLYLGSDGLVLDGTAPVISAIENGKSYCAAVTVTVTDANLDTVTVNGAAVALTDGKLTLSPTGTEQKVVATDKAGNSTTVTVTVYDGHAWDEGIVTIAPTASKKGVKTYACTHCGETKTEEIAMLAPSVTEGQNGSWKPDEGGMLTFKSNAAFNDFIRVLVDGKEIDEKSYELKEGSIIVTLKADYLATLPVGTHTLGIESATGTASTEFTITAKTEDKTPSKPGDTDSPQTGDNSNMPLWIALLLVSGGALTVFSIKSRKRKAIR